MDKWAKREIQGRDELNLIEFPICLLSDRAPPGCNTLVFEDQTRNDAGEVVNRSLTILASERYGMPTSTDDDVLLALMALSREINDFASPEVTFGRKDLLALLGWNLSGRSYQRLDESLNRWAAVTLVFNRSWHEGRKRYTNQTFHVIDNVDTSDKADKLFQEGKSTIRWNKVVWQSLNSGYVRSIDLNVYFGIRSGVTRRIYRYLRKWLQKHGRLEYDIKRFAFDKIGIGRKYDVGEIKRLLRPAIREIEELGVITPMEDSRRFVKESRGCWKVIFVRPDCPEQIAEPLPLIDAIESPPASPTADPKIVQLLVDRKLGAAKAKQLVEQHPPEWIRECVAAFDVARKNCEFMKNPPGYLVASIEGGYTVPTKAKPSATAPPSTISPPVTPTDAGELARRAREQASVDEYLAGLSAEDAATLRRDAFLPEKLSEHDKDALVGPFKKSAHKAILEREVRRRLGLSQTD